VDGNVDSPGLNSGWKIRDKPAPLRVRRSSLKDLSPHIREWYMWEGRLDMFASTNSEHESGGLHSDDLCPHRAQVNSKLLKRLYVRPGSRTHHFPVGAEIIEIPRCTQKLSDTPIGVWYYSQEPARRKRCRLHAPHAETEPRSSLSPGFSSRLVLAVRMAR